MQPSDAFGVALRVLGLWFLYVGVYRVIFLAGEFYTAQHYGVSSTPFDMAGKISIGFHLFLALILLASADKIVRLFYARAA